MTHSTEEWSLRDVFREDMTIGQSAEMGWQVVADWERSDMERTDSENHTVPHYEDRA